MESAAIQWKASCVFLNGTSRRWKSQGMKVMMVVESEPRCCGKAREEESDTSRTQQAQGTGDAVQVPSELASTSFMSMGPRMLVAAVAHTT
jgi:hypothetical protein